MSSKNKQEETATAQVAPKPEAQEPAAQATPVVNVPESTPVPAETESSVSADKDKEDKKQRPAAKSSANVLESAGRAAIARHGFAEVFVTSDGLAFRLRSDAQNHAAALANKDIVKVTRI